MDISLKCNVAILAGGKGTRLSSRLGGLPKPMVSILGKPVLQHQIELCSKFGFNNIALLVHYNHEAISNFFGDGSLYGVRIHYAVEELPRGTAGALRDSLPILADRFFVLYGDTFIDVDLRKMWNAHVNSCALGTLLLHPNDHPHDSDLVEIDAQGIVSSILPYPHPPGIDVRNLVNAALYVLESAGLEEVTPIEGSFDIAKYMFPRMLSLGRRLNGYMTPEYIKDMGTPERLDLVEQDFVAGLPEKLSTRHLRSAVFLDRDGTLIREVNHLVSPDQLELLPNVTSAMRRLNRNGTLAVIVTNQPVVARGDITIEGLAKIHSRLESQLGIGGAFIDGLYFCPHHPDKGFPGEVHELKRACICRKPEPGLIDLACRELGISRQNSWMIGDMTSDVEAGYRAGVRTVLIRSGHAGDDAKYAIRPDYIAPDLSDAVEWILYGHADLTRRVAPVAVHACRDTRLVLIGGLARAGKRYVSQVLKELLHALGRQAHVISLDSWLNHKYIIEGGKCVLNYYDLSTSSAIIAKVAKSRSRLVLYEPLSDRFTREIYNQQIEHSVGPEDVLIVEGVPALLMDDLLALSCVMKVYVDAARDTRESRLKQDYALRGILKEEQFVNLASRDLDEVSIVEETQLVSDFIIESTFQRKKDQ